MNRAHTTPTEEPNPNDPRPERDGWEAGIPGTVLPPAQLADEETAETA